MKKILLLISVLIISSGCLPEEEAFFYKLSNNSTSEEQCSISFIVSYPLPENRLKDFIGTMSLFLTKPELSNETLFSVEYNDNAAEDGGTGTGFGYGMEVTIDNNSNFSSSITDPKDINYYTNIVTYQEQRKWVDNTVKVYLRQDQNLNPTAVSYLIMAKPHNIDEYGYIGHAYLNQLDIKPAGGLRKPLPDILK